MISGTSSADNEPRCTCGAAADWRSNGSSTPAPPPPPPPVLLLLSSIGLRGSPVLRNAGAEQLPLRDSALNAHSSPARHSEWLPAAVGAQCAPSPPHTPVSEHDGPPAHPPIDEHTEPTPSTEVAFDMHIDKTQLA